MKEYHVYMDGHQLVLRYTLAEREWIEDQFKRPDGTPGSLGALVQGHLLGAGSVVVQATLVAAGLRHYKGNKWDVDKVKAEFAKATLSEDGVKSLNTAAFKAILTSGVCGRVVEDPDEAEGKEQEAET